MRGWCARPGSTSLTAPHGTKSPNRTKVGLMQGQSQGGRLLRPHQGWWSSAHATGGKGVGPTQGASRLRGVVAGGRATAATEAPSRWAHPTNHAVITTRNAVTGRWYLGHPATRKGAGHLGGGWA